MKTPPRIVTWILSITNRKRNREIVLGDFAEFYDEIYSKRGMLIAYLWVYSQAARSIPRFILTSIYWGAVMIINYIKMALRNFSKHKVFTAINILGLSVGLTCSILFYLFVQHELSYDLFHKHTDNIYSVINTDHYYDYNYRHIPNAAGPALKEFFPEIGEQVRIAGSNTIIKTGDTSFEEEMILVDKNFFNMFSFQTIVGNPEKMLEEGSSIVLTESYAAKYFGTANPAGKIMTVIFGSQTKEFIVNGIVEDPPSNSTIQFNMLVNIDNLKFFRGPEALISWTWPRSYTYIRLKDENSPASIEARMNQFVETSMAQVIEERKSSGRWIEDSPTIEFWLQSLKDVYLKSDVIAANEFSNINNSIILATIGFLVLLIAGINFVNISIGRASARSTEVGIRKVLGAEKRNLLMQHWVESISVVTISMATGLLLTLLLLPLFNEISNKNLLPESIFQLQNIWIFCAAIVLIGIAAGSFPGLILSNFHPVSIIKGKLKIGGNNLLTKSLIVLQFSASVFLIISTLTMNRQLEFINSTDLGFDKEGIIMLDTYERNFGENERIFNLFNDKTESYEDIISVSGCALPFSTNTGEGMLTINGKRIHFNFNSVHYNYIKTMGMTIIEGRDFSGDVITDKNDLIVNEEFVKQAELDDPIGTEVTPGSKIIGVVKDYHYRSLQHKIEPVIHHISERMGPKTLLVRISMENTANALSSLEQIWKEILPDKPFNYTFFDEDLAKNYAKEQRWNSITFYSSILAVLITCLGFIGMTAIITSRRYKEIGIRKVFGASVKHISQNLLNNFILLIGISYVITFPIAFYLMNKWLEDFAYRTTVGTDVFIIAGAISLVITILTISYQVVKAAKLNPVDTLKYE